MSFPNFYVTYCVMGPEAGTNPFGHTCLILSKQEAENQPVSVVDCFGFYSQPSTSSDFLLSTIKNLIGLKVDLQGGHGILKQEIVRELDGNGLTGKSFAVSEEQFDAVLTLIANEINDEDTAIKTLNEELTAEGLEANGQTRFLREKQKAELEQRSSRLHPFQIEIHAGWAGLDSSPSYTCKTRALDILQQTDIIDEEIRLQLECSSALTALPRVLSDGLYPIRLVSTGHPERVKSSHSDKVFYNRTWNNALFFASPLNLHRTGTVEQDELQADKESFECIASILNQVQQVEKKLRQAIDHAEEQARKHDLIEQVERVQGLYDEFRNTCDNRLPDRIIDKRLRATNYLEVATMSLTPERVNYSFLFRTMESLYAQHALLGLVGMVIAPALLAGVVGGTVFVMAALYTAYNLYEFYNEQTQFETMKQSYLDFKGEHPEVPESLLTAPSPL